MSEKYRKRRQKLRAKKKDKLDRESYQPGGFGLGVKPIETKPKRERRKRKRAEESTLEPPIKFVMPLFEVVGKKKRK